MKKILNVLFVIVILITHFIPAYSVKALCGGYQVSTIASNGTIVELNCYATYTEAKTAMLNYPSTETLVAVIYKNGNIINAKYAIAKFVPGRVITIYTSSAGTVSYTSVHTSYGTDAAFLDYEPSTNMTKIRISGYTGWVNYSNISIVPTSTINSASVQIMVSSINVRTSPSLNGSKIGAVSYGSIYPYYSKTSADGFTWYKINYNGQLAYVAHKDNWIKETTGSTLRTYYQTDSSNIFLNHYYEYRNTSGGVYQGYTKYSKKPAFITNGVKYYSFDGNYYYTSVATMLDDYRNNVSTNAVNNNPFYSYYLYLPNHSKTGYTADDFNSYINILGYDKEPDPLVTYASYDSVNKTLSWVDGLNRSRMSLLVNQGQSFIDAANTYGINALMMLGTAINESATGTSLIAFYKNNLFGLGAVDSNPVEAARSYLTPRDSIFDYAKFTGANNSAYSNPNGTYYFGSHYGNKGSGQNISYATDPYWGEKQAQNSLENDKAFGYQDLNVNTIGVTNKTGVKLYKSPNINSSVIYTLKNKNKLVNAIPVIVFDKVYITTDGVTTGWYKVYSDTSLNESQVIADVDYDFNLSYGYILETDLYVSNNQPNIDVDNFVIRVGDSTLLSSFATANDIEDGNIVISEDNVTTALNRNVIGQYPVTYKVEDKSKFQTTKTVIATVIGADEPIIEASDRQIGQNAAFDPKIGVRAYDKNGLDITNSVIVSSGSVNTAILGTYTITYSVTDAFANTTTKTINVHVLENQKPVINAINKIIPLNSVFNPLTGVSAIDNEDGVITSNIVVTSNNVVSSVPGTYSVTYEVTDASLSTTTLTIQITVEDKVYTNKVGDFYFNQLDWSNNLLNVSGSLAITGMNNLSTTDITYSFILSDNNNGTEYVLPLERWVINHPTRAYTSTSYNYIDSWFKGSLDLSLIPEGEYTLYVRARSGNFESKNLFRNILGKTMVRKATNSSDGRGYLLRNNNYKTSYPIELTIRNDGLITTTPPPTSANMFNNYTTLNIVNGNLNIVGTSFNIGGDYKTTATIEREFIFENTATFDRYTFDVGSIIGSEIPLRVSDNLSKVRGWYDTTNKINLTTLPDGNYIIYIRTKTGTLNDYGELNDIFMKNIPNPSASAVIKTVFYNNRNYTISLNKGLRFRLELTIRS